MDFIDITRRWHLWNRRNLRTQISIWEYDGGHMCRFEDFTLVNGRLEKGFMGRIKAVFYKLFGRPPRKRHR